jgi:uncharacterized membrane protein (DUF373 family)
MIGAMLMRLTPLLDFTLWGSDWGENYYLLDRLLADGHHAERSLGWGRAYVDFPGLFDLAGAVALVTGLEPSTTMLLLIPCVTAISTLLVACIVLRLGGGPWAALISAVVLALIFPEVFTNSHPVPGPMGSVLMMGIMLAFIIGDTWRRDDDVDAERPMVLFVLLLLMMFVLTVTHHMSHFFLIVVLAVSYLLRKSMMVGSEPERDLWGLWSLITALALATVYWLAVADTFREEVMTDLAGVSGYIMMGLAWVGLGVMIFVARLLSRRRQETPQPPFWGASLLRSTLLVYMVIALAIVLLVSAFGFPGTGIEPGGELVLYTLPTIAVFALLVGSTDVVLRRQGGHNVVAWLVALCASFLLVVALQNRILVPYRHIPYIVEAAAILIGFGAVHLVVMFTRSELTKRTRVRHMVPVVLLAIVLAGGLVFTAYPPKAVMGGFQEGTTESELGAALWLGTGLPSPGADIEDLSSGAVATDHRLSSLSFGVGRQMATWDTAGPVLHGEGDAEEYWDVLDDIDTPYGDRQVTAVVISEDLRSGAALSQFDTARPIDNGAWDKFFEPPFIRVYDGGDVMVLYVVRPLDTTGEP